MSLPLQEKQGRGEDETLSLGMEISVLDWKERVVIAARVDQRKWDRWKAGRVVMGSVEVEVDGDGDEDLERRRSRGRVMVKVFVE